MSDLSQGKQVERMTEQVPIGIICGTYLND